MSINLLFNHTMVHMPGLVIIWEQNQLPMATALLFMLSCNVLYDCRFRSLASADGRLRFAHDIELTLEESSQLGFDPEYIDAVVTLINKLKEMDVDDKEYAILCAIILFYEGIKIVFLQVLYTIVILMAKSGAFLSSGLSSALGLEQD